MSTPTMMPLPNLFIGSSTEGMEVARHLQFEIEAQKVCQVTRWDHVFRASGYPIPELIRAASSADFAVLVATPDDLTESRGESRPAVRDNIVFESGLFVGAIGLERTYILPTAGTGQKLPSDLSGLTLLPFTQRSDGNTQAALNGAVIQIQRRVLELGPRRHSESAPPLNEQTALDRELELLCRNAESQGWVIKSNTATTLRVVSPRGRSHTLSKGRPAASREQMRSFVASLRADGLRVNSSLRNPAHDSPFTV